MQTSRFDPDRYFLIGTTLYPKQRNRLLSLLQEYANVFAWNPYEVLGVDPTFACHTLNVDPKHPPITQKGQRVAP